MVPYIGGKYRQSKWINESVNTTKSKIYVEPFGGMFWNYLKNSEKYERVVYNDFNPYNSNLFLCMKNHREFYEYIKWVRPLDEDRFYRYQEILYRSNLNFRFNKKKPDFEVGLMYSYVLTHSFSGLNPEKTKFTPPGKQTPKFEILKSKLIDTKWTEKLDEITDIECLSYEKVLVKYDSKDTHFYVDPPYYKTENYYSNHPFSNEKDHLKLSRYLKDLEGDFTLSYYYFNNITKYYKPDTYGYLVRDFHKSSGNKSIGSELLITNYMSDNTGIPSFEKPSTTMGDIVVKYHLKQNILKTEGKQHFRFSIIQGVINRKFGKILIGLSHEQMNNQDNLQLTELFEKILKELQYEFTDDLYQKMLFSKFVVYFEYRRKTFS